MAEPIRLKQYWERHGTRRPLPSLSEAMDRYGVESVAYFAPVYEKDNQCPWCGGAVNNKRRRYCSDECRRDFQNMTVWWRGRGAYAMRILYRDGFTCQDCGEFHAFINEHGMACPADDGQLEIHHIIPVADGGGDEPSNLVTLCKRCHKERHRKLRRET